MSNRARLIASLVCLSVPLLGACGGSPPPAAPTGPAKPLAVAKGEAPIDVSPVPEPEGLVVIGRVAKPEAILKTVGSWTRLPLPGGSDLVRSIADDAVGDAVDLSQPIDGAVAVGGPKRTPKMLAAFSVAVRSFDDAKAKLGARHKMVGGPNGSFWVQGIGKPDVPEAESRAPSSRGRGEAEEQDEDEEESEGCSLAHGSSGARLVCGNREGVDALTAYLTRTMPRQSWPSDVHVEVRLAPAREPVAQVRAMLPILGRSVMGSSSPALRELLEAGAAELVDFVGDTNRITLDTQIADAGATATMRVEYQSATSWLARLATSRADRAGGPPAALWHLPAETDLVAYGRGTDPKLFERPRELLGNVFLELAEEEKMPEAERRALRDLVADRVLPLFTGGMVYGKGFDKDAVDKAVDARRSVKPDDLAGVEEAERTLASRMIGWHLVQLEEPISKVGPVLKDFAQLWSRPAFTKWAKQQASSKMLAQVRTAPLPAGVVLPKETVHLEVSIPQREVTYEAGPGGMRPVDAKTGKAPAPKKFTPKPIVFHVLAVPDQGATWLAFGLDAKVVAQKAAASLSSAPDKDTFGKTATAEPLRGAKGNGGWMMTLRGLLVFTAIEERSPYAALGSLASKGMTPIVLTSASEPPSPSAAAGTSVATFRLPRAAIEDIVKVALASH